MYEYQTLKNFLRVIINQEFYYSRKDMGQQDKVQIFFGYLMLLFWYLLLWGAKK